MGYSALKKAFEKAIDDEVYQIEPVNHDDDIKEILQKVYNSNVQTLQNTMVLYNSRKHETRRSGQSPYPMKEDPEM